MQDLKEASKSLVNALMIREKYMAMSHQSFPKITARFLQNLEDNEEFHGMKEGYGKGSGRNVILKNNLQNFTYTLCQCF
jgi:D-alanyl-D-alanine carboxypeptidase